MTSVESHAFAGCTGLTSLTLPETMRSVRTNAFAGCTGITALTLPHALTSVGTSAFAGCTALTSVVLKTRPPSDFIAWAVGSSRNRTNWELTTLTQLRNVLRLITEFVVETLDVYNLNPGGLRKVFEGCTRLNY